MRRAEGRGRSPRLVSGGRPLGSLALELDLARVGDEGGAGHRPLGSEGSGEGRTLAESEVSGEGEGEREAGRRGEGDGNASEGEGVAVREVGEVSPSGEDVCGGHFWKSWRWEGRPLAGAVGLAVGEGEVASVSGAVVPLVRVAVADFEGEILDPTLDDLLGGVGTGGEVGVVHSDGAGNAGVLRLKVGEGGEGGEEGGGHMRWVGLGLGWERVSDFRHGFGRGDP